MAAINAFWLEELDSSSNQLRAYYRATGLTTQEDTSGSDAFHWMDTGTDLRNADLRGARCPDTVLLGADLTGAHLDRCDFGMGQLHPGRYDLATSWPEGFDPQSHGAVLDPAASA